MEQIMEHPILVALIIIGSLGWLSCGYYAGRLSRNHSAQNYPILRKTNSDWDRALEVFWILVMLSGPITLMWTFLVLKAYGYQSDPYPEIFTSPIKPRYKSIFGSGD